MNHLKKSLKEIIYASCGFIWLIVNLYLIYLYLINFATGKRNLKLDVLDTIIGAKNAQFLIKVCLLILYFLSLSNIFLHFLSSVIIFNNLNCYFYIESRSNHLAS